MNYERLKQLILVGVEAREELFGKEEYCLHDTSVDNAWAIRSTFLEPRDPGVIDPCILFHKREPYSARSFLVSACEHGAQ